MVEEFVMGDFPTMYAEGKEMITNLLKESELGVNHYLKENGIVIDLYGGTGAYSIALKNRFPDIKFYCVDPCINSIKAAQKLSVEFNCPIETIMASAYKIPLPDNIADSVIIRKAFQVIDPLDKCLKEIHRIVKPGGTVLIMKHINFPAYPLYYLLKSGNIDFITGKGYAKNIKQYISSKRIVHLFKNSGFAESYIVPTDFMLKDITRIKSKFIQKLLAPYAVKPFIVCVKS